jgi:hypothetical protein
VKFPEKSFSTATNDYNFTVSTDFFDVHALAGRMRRDVDAECRRSNRRLADALA